jgi:hypothetical protein
MKKCRDCGHTVSEHAFMCPSCGVLHPAKENWDGWGVEYKSKLTLLGLPLIHIAFKYRPNRTPVVAKGIIAIGQFGVGVITLAQFGVGVICVSQFSIAMFAIAQFALAYSLVAQFGLFIHQGYGQGVHNLITLFKLLF